MKNMTSLVQIVFSTNIYYYWYYIRAKHTCLMIVEPLNRIELFGFKLGFWMGQQGSIYVFVGIIWYYVWRMNRLDREHDVHEE